MSEPLRDDIKARLAKYRRPDDAASAPLPDSRWLLYGEARLRIGRVAGIVAGVWGIPIQAMPSPRRARVWARPRQAAMGLCCHLLPHCSLPQIGRVFDRDHTTVMYARDKCREWMESSDPELADFQANYRKAEELCRAALGHV